MREYLLLHDDAEKEERRRWERARWQMFLALNMNPYVKHKPSTPERWMPFSWEKETESQRAEQGDWIVTDEESKELNKMLEEFIKSR